jgi:hypothetical protein
MWLLTLPLRCSPFSLRFFPSHGIAWGRIGLTITTSHARKAIAIDPRRSIDE